MTKYLHYNDCKCGKSRKLGKNDPWWVNAPAFYNCFWTYLRHNNRNHTLQEVADLLELSISAITSIEKKAYSKLRNKIKLLNLK